MKDIDFREWSRQNLSPPRYPGFWRDALDPDFSFANELAALYVLRLVEQAPPSASGWFGAWRESYAAFYQPIFHDVKAWDRSQVRAELEAIMPSSRAMLQLFDFVWSRLDDLVDGKSAEQIFFGPEQIQMWDTYFSRENDLYQISNRLAVAFAHPSIGEAASILELGGGLGSAALTLFDAMSQSQRRDCRMTFTDVAPIFLSRARRRLKRAGFDHRAMLYDINDPPPLEENSFDLIYAVNVMHVAKDLEGSLARVRKLLNPEGRLVLVEATRPTLATPIYPEFVFGFFRDFHGRILTENRPKSGFLTPGAWRNCLNAAGFERTEIYPSIEETYDDYPFVYATCLIAGA